MRLIILSVLIVTVAGCTFLSPYGEYGSDHGHADFKVYINGAAHDFSLDKYQSPGIEGIDCGNDTTKLAHLHNNDGDIAHKHATGVDWKYFFSSIGMEFSDSCLKLDTGEQYCNTGDAAWRFFVDGKEVSSMAGREIADHERILMTYNASPSELQRQLDSVTNKSATESTEDLCYPAGFSPTGSEEGH